MPIEMNNEINRHLDQYGAGAKYGFRVRDGFCFALLDLQVMQSKDGNCEKDKPQAMYVVYKTFMNEVDMADTQLSAIDKSHYDAWLRYGVARAGLEVEAIRVGLVENVARFGPYAVLVRGIFRDIRNKFLPDALLVAGHVIGFPVPTVELTHDRHIRRLRRVHAEQVSLLAVKL